MAFLVDEALALRLSLEDLGASKSREAARNLIPGTRYADETDYDDPLPDGPVASPHPGLRAD